MSSEEADGGAVAPLVAVVEVVLRDVAMDALTEVVIVEVSEATAVEAALFEFVVSLRVTERRVLYRACMRYLHVWCSGGVRRRSGRCIIAQHDARLLEYPEASEGTVSNLHTSLTSQQTTHTKMSKDKNSKL